MSHALARHTIFSMFFIMFDKRSNLFSTCCFSPHSFIHLSLSTGLAANSKAPVSVERIVCLSFSWHISLFLHLLWFDGVYRLVLVSNKGDYRSAEEESGKIWHECFIHFTKGICICRIINLKVNMKMGDVVFRCLALKWY